MAEASLELIMELQQRALTELGKLRGDVRELTQRVGHLQELVAGHGVQLASVSVRIDRLGERADRIERRLDLDGVPA